MKPKITKQQGVTYFDNDPNKLQYDRGGLTDEEYERILANIQDKTVTVTQNGTVTVQADAGRTALKTVTINTNVQPNLITKSITANGTYNAASDNADGYSSFTVNVVPELPLDVTIYSGLENLFGKVASDLQENLVLTSTGIVGTSKYISDYTGFSSKAEEQYGHYIALHAESVAGASITAELVGGTKGPVLLDNDGIIVFRIANNTQSVRFVATKGNKTLSVTYTLTNLILEIPDIAQEGDVLIINNLDNSVNVTQNDDVLILEDIGGNE